VDNRTARHGDTDTLKEPFGLPFEQVHMLHTTHKAGNRFGRVGRPNVIDSLIHGGAV
jgi:hypothetical protein